MVAYLENSAKSSMLMLEVDLKNELSWNRVYHVFERIVYRVKSRLKKKHCVRSANAERTESSILVLDVGRYRCRIEWIRIGFQNDFVC